LYREEKEMKTNSEISDEIMDEIFKSFATSTSKLRSCWQTGSDLICKALNAKDARIPVKNTPRAGKMKTSDGYEWAEVEPGYWKDETTGLVWGPMIGKFSFDEAQKKAAELNDLGLKWSVPTRKEWMMAEIHDVCEVLPEMDYWFWSSSSYPPVPDYAYGFNGGSGYSDDDYRLNTVSVRCVGRKI